jgi:hypothetical protein
LLDSRLEEDIQAFQESEEASKAMANVPEDDSAFSSRRQSRVSSRNHFYVKILGRATGDNFLIYFKNIFA